MGRSEGRVVYTLDILALRYERSKNFTLSNSVCSTTSVKLAAGSIVPVLSSIVSICAGACGQPPHHSHSPPTRGIWFSLPASSPSPSRAQPAQRGRAAAPGRCAR